MSVNPLAAAEPRDLVGRTISHFRVLEVLGKGGMGVVYKAEDELLRRVVALKVLPPGFMISEEKHQRFLREARTAAALTHPNIAVIYEVGEVDGTVFIAMELVPGKTLRDAMRGDALPLPRALGLGVEVARALARAHDAGVVHRDLKPENVMIAGDDVKLLDFGIAKLPVGLSMGGDPATPVDSDVEVTAEGALIGTPEYMSPEQLRSEPLGPQSDVFAFGVLLYEMLTGRRPFLRGSLLETASAIWNDAPASVEGLAPATPPEVVAIVDRCLAKKPSERYADAGEVLSALRVVTGATSSASGTAPPPRPTQKTAQKTPSWVAFAIALDALLCACAFAWVLHAPASADATPAPPVSATAPPAPGPARAYVERRIVGTSSPQPHSSRISPDGATVAYVERDHAYFQPSRGGERQAVAPPQEGAVLHDVIDFLPSGALLVEWTSGSDEVLWSHPLQDGAAPSEVARLRGVRAVSPDGKLVAVVRDDGLFVQPLTGGGGAPVRVASRAPRVIAWSPASDAIACGSTDAARVGLVDIVSIDGKTTQHVLSDPLLVNSSGTVPLAWPRKDALLASLVRGGGSVLVELPLDAQGGPAGPPRERHALPEDLVGELSTAGDVVLVEKQRTEEDVFIAPLAPDMSRLLSPLAPLTVVSSHHRPAGFLDDGRVLFRSDHDGPYALFAQAPHVPVERISGEGITTGYRLEDGDIVGWRDMTGGGCELVRLKGGAWQRLFAGAHDDDGSSDVVRCASEIKCAGPSACVAEEQSSDKFTFSAVDLATGKKLPPIHEVDYARGWALSPDGAEIAVAKGRDAVIDFVDVTTHAVRPLRVAAPEDDGARFVVQFVAYAPDRKHLLLTGMRDMRDLRNGRDGGDTYVLVSSDLAGHTRLLASTGTSWFFYPYLDAGGGHVAVGERRYQETFWLLDPTAP